MDINELTIKQARELATMFGGSNTGNSQHPYQIGENYFIRTVTMIQIGKLKAVTNQELVLKQACWVADTGRFTEALSDGTLSEVELFPPDEDVIVGRNAIIDACVWKHELPKDQK